MNYQKFRRETTQTPIQLSKKKEFFETQKHKTHNNKTNPLPFCISFPLQKQLLTFSFFFIFLFPSQFFYYLYHFPSFEFFCVFFCLFFLCFFFYRGRPQDDLRSLSNFSFWERFDNGTNNKMGLFDMK